VFVFVFVFVFMFVFVFVLTFAFAFVFVCGVYVCVCVCVCVCSCVQRPEKLSPAEIAAICQEAGLLAVRANRYIILNKDFETAYKNNVRKSDTEYDFYN